MLFTNKYKITIVILLCTIISSANNKINGRNISSRSNNLIGVLNDDYVVDKLIDLNGKTIRIPECGRIVFIGSGRISNGTIEISPNTYDIVGGWGVFDNVKIVSTKELGNSVKSSMPHVNARWFCTSADDRCDNTESLQQATDAAHNLFVPLYLPRGYYKISKSLELLEGDVIIGEYSGIVDINNQKSATFIRYNGNGPSMINVRGKYVTYHS